MALCKVVWKRFQVLPRLKGIIVGLWEAQLLWAYFDSHMDLGAGVRDTSPAHFCNTRTLRRCSTCRFIFLRNQLGILNLSPLSLSPSFSRVWFFLPFSFISLLAATVGFAYCEKNLLMLEAVSLEHWSNHHSSTLGGVSVGTAFCADVRSALEGQPAEEGRAQMSDKPLNRLHHTGTSPESSIPGFGAYLDQFLPTSPAQSSLLALSSLFLGCLLSFSNGIPSLWNRGTPLYHHGCLAPASSPSGFFSLGLL